MGSGEKEDAARKRAAIVNRTPAATIERHVPVRAGGTPPVEKRKHPRVADLDWRAVDASLEEQGFAKLPPILSPDECGSLAGLYKNDALFRSRIDMARFRFGVGEYKYFAAPLPAIVQTLREDLYARLAPMANAWTARGRHAGRPLQAGGAFPATLDGFLRRCHAAGQTRPTPLLLSYTAGGYNCLHQDIYGELAFPLQVVFVLSRLGADYTGGEFLLVEQRPRAQSRGHAIAVEQGAAVVFATRERPMTGTRGTYRVVMRHGVSTLTTGARMSLGIIFHDAK
jgi:uncharacterized protein